MLYELNLDGTDGQRLKPVTFLDFSKEERLENLLAEHLFDVLFEDQRLMPIFRERSFQSEADLYALNEAGDLVLFELKRATATAGAMPQILGYAQKAGRWSLATLQEKFDKFQDAARQERADLAAAHQSAFGLARHLSAAEFNRHQRLYVVGSAADDALILAVDYWKKSGLSVEFVPYRIYDIGGKKYFEFFSLPYDIHQNPSEGKGVLFDTNATYDEDAVWAMVEKRRVAAYGGMKHVVTYLGKHDYVFYVHRGLGVIGGAQITGKNVKSDGQDEMYWDVKFLTPVPRKEEGIVRWMPHAEASRITGKNFYWPRTLKVPYLSVEESERLLGELKVCLREPAPHGAK